MINPDRKAYIDNLRSFAVFLVVVMHSNVAYSGMGRWYYTEGIPESLDIFSRVVFGLYGSFVQAWFMGILFFIAGYFAASSLRRKGFSSFIKERLFRLGTPLMLYVFIINPLMIYFMVKRESLYLYEIMNFPEFYSGMIRNLDFIGATGPLWFAEALLIFCAAYTVIRRFYPVKAGFSQQMPSRKYFASVIFIISVLAFILRLMCPIGSAFFNLQIGFFASYIILFYLGIKSSEMKWFDFLGCTKNIFYLKAAVFAGIPAWGILMILGGALSGKIPIEGGFYWQSAGYALWESFTAVTMTLGLTAFFAKYVNQKNRISGFISENSFGVYVFHAPVLTLLLILFSSVSMPMLLKHIAVFPAAYILSLGVSWFLRRIPFIAEITK